MKISEKISKQIAEFRFRLSQYFRVYKPGFLVVRPATRQPSEIKLPTPLKHRVDVVRYTAEERQRYR